MGVDYYAVLDVQRKADLYEIRKGLKSISG
jgi:curved DNA-binding protein CbpA